MSVKLLKKACDIHGQRGVAKLISKSPATVNLLLKGKYPNPQKILQHVQEVFADLKEDKYKCHILGEIHIDVCNKYQQWAKQNKVHRDRLYMQVRHECINCTRSNNE
jgi:hypothetical protein